MANSGKKYLLLYLKTGSGHLAPAKSISKIFERNFNGDIQPVLIDGFEKTNIVIKFLIEGGYRNLQSKARWFYETLYAVHKINLVAKVVSRFISFFVKPFLKDVISSLKPDKIIIFHFFLIEPTFAAINELGIRIPILTVVTDPYTAHPLWFLKKNQNFIVFSHRLKSNMVKLGILEKNINVFPFILNEKFSLPFDKTLIQKQKMEMGFNIDKKVVLLLGGGDGIPQGYKILNKLLEISNDFEIAVVCGKNKSLKKKAEKLKQKNSNLKVYGYVDFVYELLNISDLVISKCGASTFMEILMSRKIPIITNYMWEQEKGNVEFLVEKGLGIYEPRISKLPLLVSSLLKDNSKYQSFITNIENENLENGCEKVALFIEDFNSK